MTQQDSRRGATNGLVVAAGFAIAAILAVVVGGNILLQRAGYEPIGASPASAAVRLVPLASAAAQPRPAASSPAQPAPTPAFQPPPARAMPEREYGKVVRLGEQLFLHTSTLAKQYVGNDLNCSNCHLDAGRQPNSAPMWAAFVHYPAYRAKTGKVDTLASRLQGCFQYSMNGKAPPADDPVLTALQAYFAWLATGAPVGKPLAGSGYPKLAKPAQAPDYGRGEKAYAANCAVCHGAEGQGQRVADQQVFPPLWGPRSFNWGRACTSCPTRRPSSRRTCPWARAAA